MISLSRNGQIWSSHRMAYPRITPVMNASNNLILEFISDVIIWRGWNASCKLTVFGAEFFHYEPHPFGMRLHRCPAKRTLYLRFSCVRQNAISVCCWLREERVEPAIHGLVAAITGRRVLRTADHEPTSMIILLQYT